MQNKFDAFVALHQQATPLLIGNVWDVQSARVFEQQQFSAIATSSAAVAETLGYADGQLMSLDEYLFVVKHIAAAVAIPFSVDLEAGYGNTAQEICNNIVQLHNMGVAGINIEDSIVADGKRSIEDAGMFTEKLRHITRLLQANHIDMFINVRSDCFLLGLPNAPEEALKRTALYQNTGVHGLFFPCVTKITDIANITARTTLPVNVMCMPGLPGFRELQQAGVKRISMGPFLYKKLYQSMATSVETIVTEDSFDSLF
jgi:2-methylisocitrate lyase-like PEP mutase family enzyme